MTLYRAHLRVREQLARITMALRLSAFREGEQKEAPENN
jgi:hypothetical protein